MNPSDHSSRIAELVHALEQKYAASGQNLTSHLEGLLHADYLSYWDYVHLDTLLSLQTPKTPLPDEMVFITYHQVSELYFKLILWEMGQIGCQATVEPAFFTERMQRINRYMELLVHSFDVMRRGMEPDQFLKFRMALLPASGFQSVQFRMMEIHATEFIQLIDKAVREEFTADTDITRLYPHIYWKKGAMEEATGKETLTLRKFEEKYATHLIQFAEACRQTNLWATYQRLRAANPEIEHALRQFDALMNVEWQLAHFRSATHYLGHGVHSIAATGGTNWQAYLPPVFQKRIFYPTLWTTEEKQNWGKDWVEKHVLQANG